MFAAEHVQFLHQGGRGQRFAVHLDRNALVEFDDHVFGIVRGLGKRGGQHGNFFRAGVPGIFQDAAFEGDMEQVAVHAVGFRGGGFHGDAVLVGIFDHFAAGMEFPVGIAPGGDQLDIRFHGIGGELETDLVIALAGGAVADGVGVFLADDFDQFLADQGTRDRGAQQIGAFINRIGLHHREDEIAGEFFADVVDVAFGSASGDRLFVEAFKLFLLADVGAVADDFRVIGFLDPFDDDGGIETSRISNYNFHFTLFSKKTWG